LFDSLSSGIKTAYQEQYVARWRSKGVEVTISNNDVIKSEDALKILNDRVGGIFHLAMVLKDGLFANQSQQTFGAVYKPKCDGVINLDKYVV